MLHYPHCMWLRAPWSYVARQCRSATVYVRTYYRHNQSIYSSKYWTKGNRDPMRRRVHILNPSNGNESGKSERKKRDQEVRMECKDIPENTQLGSRSEDCHMYLWQYIKWHRKWCYLRLAFGGHARWFLALFLSSIPLVSPFGSTWKEDEGVMLDEGEANE